MGNWKCAYPYVCYPFLGMYFKLRKSSRMITGRHGTWCTIHPRNGPACVISLSYGSIKHFIIKHYSKQTVSLKGEKYNMSGCMFHLIIFPYSTRIIAIYSLLLIMEPLPQYKNRSKRTEPSVHPVTHLLFSVMVIEHDIF